MQYVLETLEGLMEDVKDNKKVVEIPHFSERTNPV